MRAVSVLPIIAGLLGCVPDGGAGGLGWPADPDDVQLNDISTLEAAPSCGSDSTSLTADSIGWLQIDDRLEEVLDNCPDALLGWDWGDEGTPVPAVGTRFGSSPVLIGISDTIPAARVAYVVVWGPGLKTPERLGVGSSVEELVAAYGTPELSFGECVIYATFESRPGLVWRLRSPESSDCAELAALARDSDATRLPSDTRVQAVGLVESTDG